MAKYKYLLGGIFILTLFNSAGCAIQLKLIDFKNAPELYLVNTVVSACPKIERPDGWSGTGILISDDGYILTDMHVSGVTDELKVTFFNVKTNDPNYIQKTVTVSGKIITFSGDLTLDLALIKVEHVPKGVKPLALARDNALDHDQPVWRFGFNNAYRWAYGLYLAKDCAEENYAGLKLILSSGPGASGGPLVNNSGEVLGIIQRGTNGENEFIKAGGKQKLFYHPPITLFMPVKQIREFINQSIKEKSLDLRDF